MHTPQKALKKYVKTKHFIKSLKKGRKIRLFFVLFQETIAKIQFFPLQAKSKSRSSSVPAGARRHTFQVPKQPSGKRKKASELIDKIVSLQVLRHLF